MAEETKPPEPEEIGEDAGSEEKTLTVAEETKPPEPEKVGEDAGSEEKTLTMAEEPKPPEPEKVGEDAAQGSEEKTLTMAEETKPPEPEKVGEDAAQGSEEKTLTMAEEPKPPEPEKVGEDAAQGSEEKTLTVAEEPKPPEPEKVGEDAGSEEKTLTMAEEPKPPEPEKVGEDAGSEEKTLTVAEETKPPEPEKVGEDAGLEVKAQTMADKPGLPELESYSLDALDLLFSSDSEEELRAMTAKPELPVPQKLDQEPEEGSEAETLAVTDESDLSAKVSEETIESLSISELEQETLTTAEDLETEKLQRANEEAIQFLSSIGQDELLLSTFSESLGLFSNAGTQLGEFTITVQPTIYAGEEDCLLVHATGQSATGDIPFGTSILAYVSKNLETLEQHHHEYLKIKGYFMDKKTHTVKVGNKMIMNKVITEGENVKCLTTSYPWRTLEGFVSEASNLLILRVMARRREIPKNMVFLAFDAETNLCESTYNYLGLQEQTVGKDKIDVFGIEKIIHSEMDLPITWQCYFLSDGHLASRVQVGVPVTAKLLSIPILVEKEEMDPKPKFEKQPLGWETDAQLYSQFTDRKEELNADHASYIRRHPEMRLLLSDFLQFLLLRKPRDVTAFTAEFFAPFSGARSPQDAFQTSRRRNAFWDVSE
ncbi:ciliogenesis-associated TTC17-interacting protein isoform X8 [Rhinatrema bivittatum]|uniref:ciliogenesis-associated TTC17-interacting protein isoform X8 n=1 Tax=Rhinatrema bivittatum TaxID=194408 RepID=UPI00112B28B6|nr:ciliogenesis-associated TTC17-interacting protein isoform X8 [Rhinatrema bivittatum]